MSLNADASAVQLQQHDKDSSSSSSSQIASTDDKTNLRNRQPQQHPQHVNPCPSHHHHHHNNNNNNLHHLHHHQQQQPRRHPNNNRNHHHHHFHHHHHYYHHHHHYYHHSHHNNQPQSHAQEEQDLVARRTAGNAPVATIDAVMGIATGVAVCGITALCGAVALLPVDVERIICILLLALGYILMPCLAALLAVRAVSSSSSSSYVHASSHPMPQLGPFLTRVLYLASSDLLAAVDACTTVFTTLDKSSISSISGMSCSCGCSSGCSSDRGDDHDDHDNHSSNKASVVKEQHHASCCAPGATRAPQDTAPLPPLPALPPQCAVCLDDVLPGTTARLLPCSHVFHKGCADAWLLSAKKNSCPLCLRAVCLDRDENMEPIPGIILPDILGAASCT